MKIAKLCSHFLLILTTTSLTLHAQQPEISIAPIGEAPWESLRKGHLITYDAVLNVIHNLEEEEWIETSSEEELEEALQFLVFISRQGIIPGETDVEQLERDMRELLAIKDDYEYAMYHGEEFVIASSSFYGEEALITLCRNPIKKAAKKIAKSVRHHKKAVIIGAVIVVATAAVVGIAIAASAGAAAGMADAAAKDKKKDRSNSQASNEETGQAISSAFQREVISFKETTAKEGQIQTANLDPSAEEEGRILGKTFIHKSLDTFEPSYIPLPSSREGKEVEWKHAASQVFSQADTLGLSLAKHSEHHHKTMILLHSGEIQAKRNRHDRAIIAFNQAIKADSSCPDPYLSRAASHFCLGNYESALADFASYKYQKETSPWDALEFSIGFTKGLGQGVKESGKEFVAFASEVLVHPIDTCKEIYDACCMLQQLVRDKEWEVLGKSCSPEMHTLITTWEELSSQQRGELAGHAFGKFGSDMVVPGAALKVGTFGTKAAKQVISACRSVKNAEKVLMFETFTQSAAKSVGLIDTQSAIKIGEEVLVSSETTTTSNIGLWLSEEEKVASIAKYRQVDDFLKPYSKLYLPEEQVRELIHQAGMPTFPRPKGIPENFRIKITDKSGGMIYEHPTNKQIQIRVMPGVPHSPFPYQQKPYIVYEKNGKRVNQSGQLIDRRNPGAHIPLEEFIYSEIN